MNKRILIFSLGPIFKEYVHGGSQKILREVAMHLGKQGHKVKILCVRRDDNFEPFYLSENVMVSPTLKFKQTFPASYMAPPYDLANIVRTINAEISKHDVFYIHDACLNYTFLCNQKIPTIISLRDYIYPETLLGAFNFTRDKIIVNSTITKENVIHTIGTYRKDINSRIEVIPNGINTDFFKKIVRPTKIKEFLKLSIEENDLVILYPHRPEVSKGIFETLELVSRLKNKHKLKNLKLLIPKYFDLEVSKDLDPHYKKIKRIMEEKNIAENILFHKWVPFELMPEYYSLGNLTIGIGNFIEAFGSNTSVESSACGTPAIISRVGAQRTTLPEDIVFKIDFGDIDEAEKIAIKLLLNKEDSFFDEKKVFDYIKNNFSFDKMLRSYEEILCNTKIMSELKLKNYKINLEKDKLRIAPWCYISKFGIYNDYKYGYETSYEKIKEIYLLNSVNRIKRILQLGITEKEIEELINRGVLVLENEN